MDLDTAKFLLENMIGRMEQDGDTKPKRWKLEGSISALEMDALKTILDRLSDTDVAVTTQPNIPQYQPDPIDPGKQKHIVSPGPSDATANKLVTLNISALDFDTPQNPDITLCLDFGTAMSKAAASRGFEDEFLELKLGEQAKQDGIAYPVVSSIFISDSGKVYFGQDSTNQSMIDNLAETQRFDSLKQEITLEIGRAHV